LISANSWPSLSTSKADRSLGYQTKYWFCILDKKRLDPVVLVWGSDVIWCLVTFINAQTQTQHSDVIVQRHLKDTLVSKVMRRVVWCPRSYISCLSV